MFRFKTFKSKKKVFMFLLTTMIASSFSLNAYADIFSGTRTLINKGSGQMYIEVYADSSISSNGYSSIFSNAIEEWGTGKYTSGKMSGFWKVSSNNSTCDVAYVTTTSTAGLLGRTYYKKRVLGIETSADANEDWAFCRIYAYKNQMDTLKMTPAQKTENFAHELGHSAKLDHPSTTQTSIMKQGVQSITLTSYDISEIVRKWGK